MVKRKPKAGAPAQRGAEALRVTGKKNVRLTDEQSPSPGDWRGALLADVRRLIHEADPEIVEERKWVKPTNPAGVPVWSHAGIVCTGESYKQVVKLTFARGNSLEDPHGLFNSSLEGNTRRAIDIRAGETLDATAFKALIQAAVADNLRTTAAKSKSPPKGLDQSKPCATQKGEKVVLLSGGNPQIAKGDGEAPVQAYIAAMPGWKRDVGQRLDSLIVQTVPNVRKAVRWNSPFYGVPCQGWFLSYHCFTKYLKVVFLRGMSLRPLPPVESKDPNTRYFHIHEGDGLDEQLLVDWIRQASEVPGDPLF